MMGRRVPFSPALLEELGKQRERRKTMPEEAIEKEAQRYQALCADRATSMEALQSIRESSPGLWDQEGGDILLEAEGREAERVLALRVCRFESMLSESLVKPAGGAAVEAAKSRVDELIDIPPDKQALVFATPLGVGAKGQLQGPGRSSLATTRTILQRIFIHISFPSVAHRHQVKLDPPNTGALRLRMAAQVSRAWRDVLLSKESNTAWEIATRLRWPELSPTLSVPNWLTLYRSRVLAADSTIENCHKGLVGFNARDEGWEFRCPVAASELTHKSDTSLFCNICRTTVAICDSEDKMAVMAAQGQCVAKAY